MENEIIIFENQELSSFITLDNDETTMVRKASDLFKLNYPDHALLEIWNCSMHNLRRRVEMCSIDVFKSSVSSCSGRKSYKADGDSLSERWSGVDDETLIYGAVQLDVLNKKAGKALEMINWMRNHASPAHESQDSVTKDDFIGLLYILKENLFNQSLPDPIHSPIALIEAIKTGPSTKEQIDIFKEEITAFSHKDLRTIFGFAMDAICLGDDPKYSNILSIFTTIWDITSDEEKTDAGMRLYKIMFDPSIDKSADNGASERLYDVLLKNNGIRYIPEVTRASIYRKLANDLARAKNTAYGWSLEDSASTALKQVGISVPESAFVEVYQEILSVWCGNYWGRSNAHTILHDFIFSVSAKQQVKIAKLFITNKRVQSELYEKRPYNYAIELLTAIKNGLTNESQKTEIDIIMKDLKTIV